MGSVRSAERGAGAATSAVLVVCDGDSVFSALRIALDADGVPTVAVRSAGEALAAGRDRDLAVAVVDADVPAMDVRWLADGLRGSDVASAVPLVVVTSGSAAAGIENVEVVPRPVDVSVLRAKVAAAIELRALRRAARDMEGFRDLVVRVMGHDLRGALQSVELGAQVILSKPEDIAVATRMATTMQRASRRMARLIEELLDFARARLQGAIPVLPVACEVDELVTSALADLEPAAAARVTVDRTGDSRVRWDRDRIGQVLSHLLGNAVQHGLPETPIGVELRGEQERVTIRVRNQGHVAPEALAKILDPFARVGSPPRRGAGLGFGLYLVDQIVRAHAGSVQVDSTPAAGTCVTVELPRCAPAPVV